MMHLAMINAVKHEDYSYLRQLLEIGFPLYQEDLNGTMPAFYLTLKVSDKIFEEGFKILRTRKFNIAVKNKKSGLCFLE